MLTIENLPNEYQNELDYLKNLFLDLWIQESDINHRILIDSISRAYLAISNYLSIDIEESKKYFTAAVKLALAYYNNTIVEINKANGKRSVTQKSQGSRSITYASAISNIDNHGLTAEVKALLPSPKLKLYC